MSISGKDMSNCADAGLDVWVDKECMMGRIGSCEGEFQQTKGVDVVVNIRMRRGCAATRDACRKRW